LCMLAKCCTSGGRPRLPCVCCHHSMLMFPGVWVACSYLALVFDRAPPLTCPNMEYPC
jgi:hypothetical protein